ADAPANLLPTALPGLLRGAARRLRPRAARIGADDVVPVRIAGEKPPAPDSEHIMTEAEARAGLLRRLRELGGEAEVVAASGQDLDRLRLRVRVLEQLRSGGRGR
ncbi:hypothetical protein, partial [Falsiroseomonas sp.]|uniref:hypothetical protein n=1 Tax=Falsiroseomonas sp. TaxID=2870721 RepID=UPI002715DA2C